MRVFMTGGTGYIGGAVAIALRNAGHDVASLARPESEAKFLRDAGVALVSGDLASLPSLREQIAEYDTFVHTAQARDNKAAADKGVIDVVTSLGKHLILTTGVWILGNTKGADESSPVNPLDLVTWRVAIEESALASGGAVLRPGCVYGGKQSLFASWFATAEQQQPISIAGDGENRWAMVDLQELADAYVRAVERRATGVLHAIDDTRATLNDCAYAISPEVAIEHTPLADARAKLGGFADALALDQVIASDATRAKLGWSPQKTFVNSIESQWHEWRSR
ncbi:MAG TPA: NAD-dependent epimerase/dehydratase family protein [Thermoanaerobaculia bacterium]